MASTDASSSSAHARPLSPHLGIYRWTTTMAMSIAHRITGLGLYAGTILLAWYLIATSMDAAAFNVVAGFLNSIVGQIILFGFTWALIHHALGGVRHAIWDTGYGLDKPMRDYLALATLIGGIVLTILIWVIGSAVR